jgi:hypothetical protein
MTHLKAIEINGNPRAVAVAELYQIQPYTYALRIGLGERAAQKAFKRMFIDKKKAPPSLGAYAGLPVIEQIGSRYRMLNVYYEAYCLKHLKANS